MLSVEVSVSADAVEGATEGSSVAMVARHVNLHVQVGAGTAQPFPLLTSEKRTNQQRK